MRVVWTDTALRHLAAIHEYIARDSPYYAHQTVDGIRRAAERLGRSFELDLVPRDFVYPFDAGGRSRRDAAHLKPQHARLVLDDLLAHRRTG